MHLAALNRVHCRRLSSAFKHCLGTFWLRARATPGRVTAEQTLSVSDGLRAGRAAGRSGTRRVVLAVCIVFGVYTLAGPALVRAESVWNNGAWRAVRLVKPDQPDGQSFYSWYHGERFFVRGKVLVVAEDESRSPWMRLPEESRRQVASSSRLFVSPDLTVHLVSLRRSANPFSFARSISELDSVEYAQPDILQWPQYGGVADRSGTDEDRVGRLATWRKTRGSGVRIAIIDDGVDTTHQDLAHLKVKRPEWLGSAETGISGEHGTRVAGILFAAHDGEGVDGVAPEAELISAPLGQGWTSDIVRAFAFSEAQGADVINCSWTLPVGLSPIVDVITALRRWGRGGRGTLVMLAAGNARRVVEPPSLSASSAVVTVGAYIPERHELRSGSGGAVDLVGPARLLSTRRGEPKYLYFGASSAATAYATGAAALVLSLEPCLAAEALLQRLRATAAPVMVNGTEYNRIRIDRAASVTQSCAPEQRQSTNPGAVHAG